MITKISPYRVCPRAAGNTENKKKKEKERVARRRVLFVFVLGVAQPLWLRICNASCCSLLFLMLPLLITVDHLALSVLIASMFSITVTAVSYWNIINHNASKSSHHISSSKLESLLNHTCPMSCTWAQKPMWLLPWYVEAHQGYKIKRHCLQSEHVSILSLRWPCPGILPCLAWAFCSTPPGPCQKMHVGCLMLPFESARRNTVRRVIGQKGREVTLWNQLMCFFYFVFFLFLLRSKMIPYEARPYDVIRYDAILSCHYIDLSLTVRDKQEPLCTRF